MTHPEVILQPPPQIRFDAGSHSRARIGYLLLATEQTVQDDVIRLRPPGVGIRSNLPNCINTHQVTA